MPTALKLPLLLAAWLFATGLHWDALQLVAWANMFANYSESMSSGDALKATVQGETCPLCDAADEGRRQDSEQFGPGASQGKAPLLPLPAHAFIVEGPLVELWPESKVLAEEAAPAPPPTPPPRA